MADQHFRTTNNATGALTTPKGNTKSQLASMLPVQHRSSTGTTASEDTIEQRTGEPSSNSKQEK
jgi:hypothetical protein